MVYFGSLSEAAEEGNLERVKTLVREYPGESIQAFVNQGEYGETPLTIACRNGHLKVVEYLIDECDADINKIGFIPYDDFNWLGASPLWWATHRRHFHVVKSLVTRYADVNYVAPLVEACVWGDLKIVKYLLDNGAVARARGLNGRSALDCACRGGHYLMALLLIRNGADMSKDGAEALEYCVSRCELRFVRLLLRYEAGVESMFFDMRPLVLTRCWAGHPARFQLFLCFPFVPRYSLEFLESLGVSRYDISRCEPFMLPNERCVLEEVRMDGQRYRVEPVNEGGEQWVTVLHLTVSAADHVGPAGTTTLCYVCTESHYHWAPETEVWKWELLAGMQRFTLPPAYHVTLTYIRLLAGLFVDMISGNSPPTYQLVLAVFSISVKEIGVEMRRPQAQRGDLCKFHKVLRAVLKMTYCLLHFQPVMSAEHVELFHRSAYEFVGVNPRDHRGCTPLLLICGLQDKCFFPLVEPEKIKEVFQLLLTVGADASAVDEQKSSPLHLVAQFAPVRYDVIDLLLESGARFYARNNDSKCFIELLPEEGRDKYRGRECPTLRCLAAIAIADLAALIPAEVIDRIPGLSQFVNQH